MELVDNKTSDLHSYLICQSYKYLQLLLKLLLSIILTHENYKVVSRIT